MPFNKGTFLQGMPDCKVCDLLFNPANPEVPSPTLNPKLAWQCVAVFHKTRLQLFNYYNLR